MKNRPSEHILVLTETMVGEPSAEALNNPSHSLQVKVDERNNDVYLNFSSRLAMYELGRSLLNEAVYGTSGMQERSPLEDMIVECVRLTSDSSRLFIFYPKESVLPTCLDSVNSDAI